MEPRRSMTQDEAIFARGRSWSGWLVVAGGVPAIPLELPGIADRLLAKTHPSLAAVWIDPEPGPNPGIERLIEEIEPLLFAPVERVGPGDAMPDDAVDVGLILVGGGDPDCWLKTLGSAAMGRWVSDRLDDGSAVFATGAAAAVLGSHVFDDEADPVGDTGLGWLTGAVLLPGILDPADCPGVRQYLSKTVHSYALGLPEGTAVAIGPQGQIEVWTGEPPKIVLGRGWIPE